MADHRPPHPGALDVVIAVEVLPHGEGLALPSFASPGAAGADVRAAVDEPMTIAPGKIALVPTGLKIGVQRGFEVQVRPRSGLALRRGITVPNAPGTIDSDYRGEVCVILMNMGEEEFVIERGDRIAQFVLARVEQFEWRVVPALDNTPRGEGGFGSTGIS